MALQSWRGRAATTAAARRGAAERRPPRLSLAGALDDVQWHVLSLLEPRCVQALGGVSAAVRQTLTASCRRARLVGRLAQELRALPYGFPMPVSSLRVQELHEALEVLRPLRLLRRVERAGQDAGMAPTFCEDWHFRSAEELGALVAAGQRALAAASPPGKGVPGVLRFGATLRLDEAQHLGGDVLWTAPAGFEWTAGPAADPLQLSLRLGLDAGGAAEVDLELGSGAWSPWAETWAFREHTLTARLAIAAPLPDGGVACIVSGRAAGAEGQAVTQGSCEAEGAAALRAALVAAGADGVRAMVCLGALEWRNELPPWCPPEVLSATLPTALACA